MVSDQNEESDIGSDPFSQLGQLALFLRYWHGQAPDANTGIPSYVFRDIVGFELTGSNPSRVKPMN